MQATFASRCLRIMNLQVSSRCLNRLSSVSSLIQSEFHLQHSMELRQTDLVYSPRFSLRFSLETASKTSSTPNGYALFSSETEQKSTASLKKVGASGELVTNSKIISTLEKYLWMKENVEFRLRVITALALLIGAKVPFLFKLAVDWLTTATGNAGALTGFSVANSSAVALFSTPVAVLIGSGIARSGAAAFNGRRPPELLHTAAEFRTLEDGKLTRRYKKKMKK